MTYPDAKQLMKKCEERFAREQWSKESGAGMEKERLALQATILQRQRRERWTAAAAFFWLFAAATAVAIVALFLNR